MIFHILDVIRIHSESDFSVTLASAEQKLPVPHFPCHLNEVIQFLIISSEIHNEL